MNKVIFIFITILLFSCKDNNRTFDLLEKEISKSEVNIEDLRASVIVAEKSKNEKFVLYLNKEKELFFENKVDVFFDKYESFYLLNVLKRKFINSEETNNKEIDRAFNYAFEPIDYRRLQEDLINKYLDTLNISRQNYLLKNGKEFNKWNSEKVTFKVKEDVSIIVNKNLEGHFSEQILMYTLELIDIIEIILVIFSSLSIFSFLKGFNGFNGKITVILILISIIFTILFEVKRENKISDEILNHIREEHIINQSETILNYLNENTDKYYKI